MNMVINFLVASIFMGSLSLSQSGYASDAEEKGLLGKRKCADNAPQEDRQKRRKRLFCWFECRSCCEIYEVDRYPQTLKCGHSFCAPCIAALPEDKEEKNRLPPPLASWTWIACPECQKASPLPAPTAKDLSLWGQVVKYKQDIFEGRRSSFFMSFKEILGVIYKPRISAAKLLAEAGKKARCRSQFSLTYDIYSKSTNLLSEYDCPEEAETVETLIGQNLAQLAFTFSDMEQHQIAAFLLETALKHLQVRLDLEKAKPEMDQRLTVYKDDVEMVKLYLVIQRVRLKQISTEEALRELNEVSGVLSNKPRLRAQLKLAHAITLQEDKNYQEALTLMRQAIHLLGQENSGAESCTFTLIRTVADLVEQIKRDGGIPSIELLRSFDAFEWHLAFTSLKKRMRMSTDGPENARALYDLGRIAMCFGLFDIALEFMERATTAFMKTKAEFDEARKDFEDTPEIIVLDWVEEAYKIAEELTARFDGMRNAQSNAAGQWFSLDDPAFRRAVAMVLAEQDKVQAFRAEILPIFQGI